MVISYERLILVIFDVEKMGVSTVSGEEDFCCRRS